MTTATKLLTAEEFFCLPDNGMKQELIDGKVIEMPLLEPDTEVRAAGSLWP